jgi:hypothetical protein
MLIGAHISQVASSTPFLCCSRFSPIAFNLSNTKPSIQILHVPDCPFRRPKPNRSYPTRPPLQAGRASPFYALVDQAITFDQLSCQHSKRESGNSSESGGKKQRRQDEVPTKDSSSASSPKPQLSSSGNSSSLSHPRGSLTPAEKDFRTKHHLCMYCGKPGHTVQDCNNAPKSTPPSDSSSSASVSLIYSVPTSGPENWRSQPPRM